MKELARITIGLTFSCLIAAFVMGSVFTVTYKAKKRNEHQDLQETMLNLLGYDKHHPAPPELKLYPVYRYIINDRGKKYLGYLVPVKGKKNTAYELLMVTLEGRFVAKKEIPLSPEASLEAPERAKALNKILTLPKTFSYADSTIVAKLGDRRIAYLLPGEFPGFKTFIKVMLALDPKFSVLGLDIMEEEEDPGLGGEIKQDYFKNQFRDKTFEKIKNLKVVKKPLPEEYRHYLEAKSRKDGNLSREEISRIRSKYRNEDIYALTGATISSKAVTDGVKAMIKKFAYRVKTLDRIIGEQGIHVAF